MATRLAGGITVGYVLMAGLFVLVWALEFAYGRLATRRWDARVARVIELARPVADRPAGERIVFLAGLVYALAASTNLPLLVLALGWRRFSTAGAVLGIAPGTVAALALIVLSPAVWPGDNPPVGLNNPAIVSMPLGFLGCWLGSVLWPEPAAERRFSRLNVRADTGLGAERAVVS